MHKVDCIIIEDEPLAAKLLADYVAKIPYLSLKGIFRDTAAAENYLLTNNTGLVFLDIHLPNKSGMDFLRSTSISGSVIVTTAYPQYAVEGFDLSVTDYLLKPFSFERFQAALHKYLQTAGVDNATYFDITVQKKKQRIFFNEILYIESQREYVKIVTTQNEWLTRMGTQQIEALLPRSFQRIHRSYIINKQRIKAYNADSVEIGDAILPVGRGYKGMLE